MLHNITSHCVMLHNICHLNFAERPCRGLDLDLDLGFKLTCVGHQMEPVWHCSPEFGCPMNLNALRHVLGDC